MTIPDYGPYRPYTGHYSYYTALCESLQPYIKPILDLLAHENLRFLDLPWTPYYTQNGNNAVATTIEHPIEYNYASCAVALTILLILVFYTWEHYLDTRQKRMTKQTEFPNGLKEVVEAIDNDRDSNTDVKEEDTTVKDDNGSDEVTVKKEKEEKLLSKLQSKFSSSQLYSHDKLSFSMLHSTYSCIESIIMILLGALPFMWDVSLSIVNSYYLDPDTESKHEIKITCVFFTLTSLLSLVMELPWDYYSTFHIEKRHGFNKSTRGLFFTDKIKGLLLSTIIGFPVLSVIITLIKQGGPYFYLYIWAFMFAFSIIMMTLVPILIMPLFNKYTPLEDGVLKTKTVELAKRLKYPLKSMFVMDGSRRSSHSNAFLYGFGGNKRIVLFDTLIKQVKVDEIV